MINHCDKCPNRNTCGYKNSKDASMCSLKYELKIFPMEKIIFLDIDGVLNNTLFYSQQFHNKQFEETRNKDDIDIRNIELLNEIIEKTNAKVVISSTWRMGSTVEELQKRLEVFGFKGEIIGLTPVLRFNGALRGNEIYLWLEENDKKDVKYIILDDDSDMLLWQTENFIKTDRYVGLTPTNTHKAIWRLNEK